MNGLLILFGESFRYGGQGNRNTGSTESYNGQINACETQIKFINQLKEKHDVNISVIINSYNTKYNNELCEIYKPVLIDKYFHKNLIGQNGLIHHCIKNIKNIKEYDFVLYMRIDLFLKEKFIDVFNPKSNKILFPSICFEPHHKCGIHPRVNDMMMFIPNKYFYLINHITLNHESWYDLVTKYKLNYEDIDMMLNTYHDSDSAKDFNPIYYIVNRHQEMNHRTKKIFNKYKF